MNLIKATKKNETLVREMDELVHEPSGLHIWWLGQSGFLLQCGGKRILIDPYLSNSLTKKYEHTNKPHIRMSELVIRPQLLKNITVVTSSHNHTDHLDAETLQPILANNPSATFIIPEANRIFVAERVKCSKSFPTGMIDEKSIQLEGMIIHGLPAKHNEIVRDEKGNPECMGYVFDFLGYKIYHSGDTLWFDEMINILKPFQVDLAILPINGNNPKRKVAGNLNCNEAAVLAKTINASMVIPCHYNMFTFNTADVNDFKKECEHIGQEYIVLQGGELFTLHKKKSV
ncbi:MAG: MBL fold metallo-hydrolase [Niabella sp.]